MRQITQRLKRVHAPQIFSVQARTKRVNACLTCLKQNVWKTIQSFLFFFFWTACGKSTPTIKRSGTNSRNLSLLKSLPLQRSWGVFCSSWRGYKQFTVYTPPTSAQTSVVLCRNFSASKLTVCYIAQAHRHLCEERTWQWGTWTRYRKPVADKQFIHVYNLGLTSHQRPHRTLNFMPHAVAWYRLLTLKKTLHSSKVRIHNSANAEKVICGNSSGIPLGLEPKTFWLLVRHS